MDSSNLKGTDIALLLSLLLVALVMVLYLPLGAYSQQDSNTNSTRPFGLVITLYGLDNTTSKGNIISFVNADNITKVKVTNSTQLTYDPSQKGIIRFSIPEADMKPSDEYTVCIVETLRPSMQCQQGHKSPENRAEYVEFLLSP